MGWEIDLARKYARKGHSITFTAQFIGLTPKRLRQMIDDAGADIQFAKGRQSLAFQEGLKRAAESRRGKPVTQAILDGLARGRQKMRERWLRLAFGRTGTQAELHRYFKCPVALSTLRWRTRHGMSIEDGLTSPPRRPPKGVTPPQFIEQVKKSCRRAAARVRHWAQRRLTTTMLQYQSLKHDIVVTTRDGIRITVEVRDRVGNALHRLRFIASFESGVLFVFDPEERGRIQFLAFEPDSPAII
jgi:hypothetical protein